MFKDTLILVLRGLRKDFGFSFINIAGLAIGLAACWLIMVFVSHEISYDKHFERAEDIVRITIDADIGGSTSNFAIAPFAAFPAFRDNITSIEKGVRVQEFDGQVVIGGESFEEEEIILTDSSFFEVFDRPFISGSASEALNKPGSVVITAETAMRLFGREDVLGEPLNINDTEMAVSGVVANPEHSSHITYDIVVSIMNLPPPARTGRDGAWYAIGMWTYVILAPGTDIAQFETRMAEEHERLAGDLGRSVGISYVFNTQPLADIHLRSQLQAEFGTNGDIATVSAFAIIALFILLIACINFTNLSTARSTIRAKEVGVRKAVGAQQKDLVFRFLTESFVTVLISTALAAIITVASLGLLSNVTGRDLSADVLISPGMIISVAILVILCSLIAGAYPAFVMSAFKPMQVLRGQVVGSGAKSPLRQGLVVVQFAVSVILITGTMVVQQQVKYMKNKPLGFDKGGVAVIQMDTANDTSSWESFRQQLLGQASITDASYASGVPGQTGELRLFVPEGSDSTQTYTMTVARVDYDYIDTYGMKMAAGRFYDRDYPSDSTQAFVINEAAARQFGWNAESAIGKSLEWRGVQDAFVVGVVADYHFRPLTEEIAPLAFYLAREPRGLLSVRFAPGSELAGMEAVRTAWQEFEVQRPLDITFVDEDMASRYQDQEAMGGLITTFALLAIFIASLGLFGLASFAVQRRTKEIGIRKVLGATASQLVALVTREFVVLLGIAIVIAWPAAYYLLSNFWLDQFPYRIELGFLPFIVAGLVALVLTVATTLYHSTTAAIANPVKSLRVE